MPLSKEIYTKAKKYVGLPVVDGGKNLNSYDLFAGSVLPDNLAINSDPGLFTIACLRLLMQDKSSFTDPIEQEEAFRTIARTVRLNEFAQFKKDIDLGFGQKKANNLLYKLAYEFYKNSPNWTGDVEKTSKDGLIAHGLSDPAFYEYLSNVRLTDPHTYECIAKQAFYMWHYENFINTTAIKDVLKKENAGDGSVIDWSEVEVTGDQFSIFISRSGAPFNAGYPVFCVIFEGDKDDLLMENKGKLTAKAFDYLFPLVGRKKYSDLDEFDQESIEDFVLVKEFTHKSQPHAPFRIKVLETGDKIKVCVGADYAQLIWAGPRSVPPKQSYYDFIEYGLANLGGADLRYHLVQKSLSATNNKATDVIFDEQIGALVNALKTKDEALQNGPALFFDVEEPKKDWYTDLVADLDEYEGIDSSETIDAILRPQFSLSLKNASDTIKEAYLPLMKQYKIQRSADPRILTMNFDSAKVLEDVVFYYDQSFNLLAIGAIENKSTKEAPALQQDRLQKNDVPFDFSLVPDQPLSLLNKYYSILPLPPDDELSGLLDVGLAGPILLVTEYFVNALYNKYADVRQLLDDDDAKIFPSQPTGAPDSIFIKEDSKISLSQNVPILIRHKELETKVAGANEVFATLLLKAANKFFVLANEIVLGDSKGGTYSFATKSLEVAGGVVNFFSSQDTFQDKDLVVADNVQSFLDRFYYPPLLIKPTVPKQKAAAAPKTDKTLPKNEGAPTTKKGAKETVVDLDDYNSANKLFAKQVFVIAAQSSDSPCLTQLADVVKTGNMNDVYAFLLTKFPWDQMVAKSLLANLRRISNLIDTKGSKDFANQVNTCLQDLNVDKILAAFANFKNSFKNLDNIVNASLPEIPKLGAAVPYVYILDFQRASRDALIAGIVEGVMASLSFLLGIMLKDLLSACEQDGSLQTMLFDSNQGSLGKDGRHAKGTMSDSVNTAAFMPVTSDEYGSKKVYVDLIALLKASRVDNLENILNSLLDLFPLIKTSKGSDPLNIMEAFLNGLSSQISAHDTKVLLNGIASVPITNKVINFASLQADPMAKVFNNKYNVALLYKHLKKFINLDLINKQIVEVTTIVPDPCFINLGNIGTEDLQLLRDFLGDGTDAYVDGLINDAANQINSACAKFADGLYKTSLTLPNLISDSSKKALQKVVDGSLTPIIDTQNTTKGQFITGTKKVVADLSLVYAGTDKPLATKTESDVTVLNVLFDPKKDVDASSKDFLDMSKMDYNKNIIWLNKSLNANFGSLPPYKSIYNQEHMEVAMAASKDDNVDFFAFFTNSFNRVDPVTDEDLGAAMTTIKDETKFTKELNKIFKKSEEIRAESKKVFDETVTEGGKNTNTFVANLKAMKRIVKSLKGKK